MPFDGFMEFFQGGKQIQGEALDHRFGKSGSGVALINFEMSSEGLDKKKKDKDKDKDKDKQGKSGDGKPPTTTSPRGKLTEDFDDYSEAFGQMFGDDKPPKYPITFKITKDVDRMSPRLYLSYCRHTDQEKGYKELFEKVVVTLRKSGGPRAKPDNKPLEFLVITLGNVFVSKYSLKTDADKLPTESVTFTCERCEMRYVPQAATGAGRPDIILSWDFHDPTKWT